MMRRVVAGLVLAALALVADAVVLRPVSWSQTLTNDCAYGPGGDSGLGGGGAVGGGAGGGGGGSWGASAPASSSTTSTTMRDGEGGGCSGLLDQVAPGNDVGPHPDENADIGYDDGGNCLTGCVSRRAVGTLTAMAWTVNVWLVRVGIGVVEWALNFDVSRRLEPVGTRIAGAYRTNVVGRMGLGPLFLTITALWAGFLAFTGRLGRGMSEMGVSLLIGALATTLLASPAAVLMGALRFTSGVSFEMVAATTGDAAPTASSALGLPMARSIHHALIETPHQIIDWGRPIPVGDRCFAVYDAAVASGPWGTSSKPRVAMKEAGCTAEDRFNRDPSPARLGLAILSTVAGGLVMVLLVLVAMTLIAAQLGVVLAVACAPVAIVFGTLPGKGRSLFWRWCASAGMALAGVMAMAVVLSFTLVAIDAMFTATSGMPLLAQMGTVDLIVVMALVKRHGLIKSGRRVVTGFTARMTGTQITPPTKSWVASAAGAYGGAAAAVRRAVRP